MLIGELAKKTGFSRDTIRYYEKRGLISLGRRERRDNNYKEYSEDILKRLLAIKRIKALGFTLNETEEFLHLMSLNEASCNQVAKKINWKVHLVKLKIKELEDLKSFLFRQLEKCPSERSEENCPLLFAEH